MFSQSYRTFCITIKKETSKEASQDFSLGFVELCTVLFQNIGYCMTLYNCRHVSSCSTLECFPNHDGFMLSLAGTSKPMV